MVRDLQSYAQAVRYGRTGGNPTLVSSKPAKKDKVKGVVNGGDKSPLKIESESEEERIAKAIPKKAGSRLPEGWTPKRYFHFQSDLTPRRAKTG